MYRWDSELILFRDCLNQKSFTLRSFLKEISRFDLIFLSFPHPHYGSYFSKKDITYIISFIDYKRQCVIAGDKMDELKALTRSTRSSVLKRNCIFFLQPGPYFLLCLCFSLTLTSLEPVCAIQHYLYIQSWSAYSYKMGVLGAGQTPLVIRFNLPQMPSFYHVYILFGLTNASEVLLYCLLGWFGASQ